MSFGFDKTHVKEEAIKNEEKHTLDLNPIQALIPYRVLRKSVSLKLISMMRFHSYIEYFTTMCNQYKFCIVELILYNWSFQKYILIIKPLKALQYPHDSFA